MASGLVFCCSHILILPLHDRYRLIYTITIFKSSSSSVIIELSYGNELEDAQQHHRTS
jgi:hypothetical protein